MEPKPLVDRVLELLLQSRTIDATELIEDYLDFFLTENDLTYVDTVLAAFAERALDLGPVAIVTALGATRPWRGQLQTWQILKDCVPTVRIP